MWHELHERACIEKMRKTNSASSDTFVSSEYSCQKLSRAREIYNKYMRKLIPASSRMIRKWTLHDSIATSNSNLFRSESIRDRCGFVFSAVWMFGNVSFFTNGGSLEFPAGKNEEEAWVPPFSRRFSVSSMRCPLIDNNQRLLSSFTLAAARRYAAIGVFRSD